VVGAELRVIQKISATATTIRASATAATHRAPRRERLASRTARSYHGSGIGHQRLMFVGRNTQT
jgi:hypothetical protein